MKYNRQDIKTIIFIAFACIAFYVGLNNLTVVFHILGSLLGVVSPFILGAAMAFVLNVLMSRLENSLFTGKGRLKEAGELFRL